MSEPVPTFAANWKRPMIRVLPKNELKALSVEAGENNLTLTDLGATCEKYGVAPGDVLNELSVEIADGFLSGSLTYDFCDGVMNGIISAIVDLGMVGDFPEPAFSLYQAFDQGEWIRSNDPPETDPSEKYTKPMVLEIMRDLKG